MMEKLHSFFPILRTLNSYSLPSLKWDILAGFTLTLFVIPESMAYASLAGLPSQAGIYACLSGGLFFALFTSSKQVAVGPTSSISLLISSQIPYLISGDQSLVISYVAATAFIVGLVSLLAYLARLYTVVNFIGDHILLGFKTGAALSIASTQFPSLLGIPAGGENFFLRMYNILQHLSEVVPEILIFSGLSFLFLYILHSLIPNKPTSLWLLLSSVIFMYLAGNNFPEIKPIPPIPSGLPNPHFPLDIWRDFGSILCLALACFLMAYIETSSVVRSLAEYSNIPVNPKQELFAISAANIASSLAGSLPVSGGLSQSKVNEQAGAKTSLALLFNSLFLIFALIFLTQFFDKLPAVILSVLIIHAMSSLVNLKDLKQLYFLSKEEFWIAIATTLLVLLFGVLNGVLIAMGLSLAALISKTSNPRIAVLGRVPGTSHFSDMDFHPDNIPVKGCLIIRIESPILYFNQQNILDKIVFTAQDDSVKLVVLDLSDSPIMDVSGSKMISKLSLMLSNIGKQLRVVNAHHDIRHLLRKQNLDKVTGPISRRITLEEVLDEFEKEKGSPLKGEEEGVSKS